VISSERGFYYAVLDVMLTGRCDRISHQVRKDRLLRTRNSSFFKRAS
jgi:hypothetical protein